MPTLSKPAIAAVTTAVLVTCCATFAYGQGRERNWLVFGDVGFASIGHSDSEQGKAPLLGAGVTLHLLPWLAVDGAVHVSRIHNVFGREFHDFSQSTATASLLVTKRLGVATRLLTGGGLGIQRAHSEFDASPVGLVSRTETIRLWHGQLGVEWDVATRVAVRAGPVIWFGEGLDWIVGGRAAIGYRF